MAIKHGNSKDNVLRGTERSDEIEGKGGNDTLYGFAGNDDLEGGSGNGKLHGGTGNDDLEGGAGNDILDGGTGRDELEGGRGNDTFIFRTGITEIDDFGLGDDTIRLDNSLGVESFAELKAVATRIGDDLVFDFGKHELRLDDTRLPELTASDFDFF